MVIPSVYRYTRTPGHNPQLGVKTLQDLSTILYNLQFALTGANAKFCTQSTTLLF